MHPVILRLPFMPEGFQEIHSYGVMVVLGFLAGYLLAYWLTKRAGENEGHLSTIPLLAIVAGDDRIADANAARQLLGQIEPDLITELYYPDNYHENFNELNRDEIFGEIVKWVEPRIS